MMACTCKQHYRHITVKGARKNGGAALQCKVCLEGGKGLSSLAKMVAGVLDDTPHIYAWEVKVFPHLGPFDFFIPELGLAVEADGEQHT